MIPAGRAPDDSVITRSAGETRAFARDLARSLGPGDIVALSGELGAGKTVLAQGLAAGLGCRDAVQSPSFALVMEHAGDLPVYHIDLYRLSGDADWEEIGLDHYFGAGGVALVEWPERLGARDPGFALWIRLSSRGGNERLIEVFRGAPRP